MARVSSDEQAKGYSLGIQEDSIKKWCQSNNVDVVKVFREDHSAKDFNRPEWKELKKFAKANRNEIDMLLVTTWDRFSRNTTDAFNELSEFKKIAIEVQAILQPIDFNIPESKILLSIYLTLPEVDNDRRSMKIREGVRAALKSGRWSRMAPVGYRNTRDANNKPLIVPGENADLIRLAFTEVSNGTSQESVRKLINKKGLSVSRTNISRLLRNFVYIGKIRVPSSEKEPEEIINGLHEAIVSNDLFYKVQKILNEKSTKSNRPKQNSLREQLPLRGILHCSVCANKLTGSASRSSTGARYYYYHCNICKKERFRANLANESIENFMSELVFDKTEKEIYNDMLDSILKESPAEYKKVDEKSVRNKIEQIKGRLDKLQDLLIDDIISREDYSKKKGQFDDEILDLENSIVCRASVEKSTKDKLGKGINLFSNAKYIYLKANVLQKQQLISSIFPEKIEFKNSKCRTIRINDLLAVMLLKNSRLYGLKKGQIDKSIDLSRQVESGRVELPSKQATKRLSTRLVPDWIFVIVQGQEQPHNAYLLSCQNSPEA